VCASLAHVVRRPEHAGALLAVGAAGWWLTGSLLPRLLGTVPGRGALLTLHTAAELFLILTAAGIGILFANAIRERNILLPAAVFAAFADYFMVRYGTVHVALKSQAGQKVIRSMSAGVPRLHPGLPLLTVGMADFVFLAFFFACVYRFDLHLKRTFVALFV